MLIDDIASKLYPSKNSGWMVGVGWIHIRWLHDMHSTRFIAVTVPGLPLGCLWGPAFCVCVAVCVRVPLTLCLAFY